MAQLTLTVTGAGSYTVSIKKAGDNTERVVSINSSTVNFTADVGTFQYTITVTAGNCTPESQNFTLECLQQGSTETPSPEYQATIPNVFVTVPKETNTDQFSPEKFSNYTIPEVQDTYLQRNMPTYLVSYEGYDKFWSNKNVSVYDKGFYSARRPGFLECTDIWVGGCSGTYESFVSALPYNKRFHMSILGNSFSNAFITGNSTETVFQAGKDYASGPFGKGDNINGKSNFAIYSIDVETGLEVGGNDNDSQKLAAMFAGMGDNISGYVYGLYVISLFTFGHALEGRYPNPDGTFNTAIPSETPGVTYFISKVWSNSFSLNGETKYLKDYKNVIEVEEVSHYSEDSFEQGEILYNSSNQPLRTINHFGTTSDVSGANGYNVSHVISRAVSMVETAVAYAKTQQRDFVSMFKAICDRGDLYIWRDHTKLIDIPYPSYYIPRHISFAGGMFVFLSGARGWHIWDYPIDGLNMDSYNGVLGVNHYLFSKYNINGNQISLADLKPNLIFNTWNTEQSYDGGNTYVKHKAIDWRKSTSYLPLRTAYTNDGYVVVFASRPYNVEPLSCKWKVTIGGTVHTGNINPSDWKSCYPEYPDRKDFVFKIIKYNGNI